MAAMMTIAAKVVVDFRMSLLHAIGVQTCVVESQGYGNDPPFCNLSSLSRAAAPTGIRGETDRHRAERRADHEAPERRHQVAGALPEHQAVEGKREQRQSRALKSSRIGAQQLPPAPSSVCTTAP
jgi:hypothetical protein